METMVFEPPSKLEKADQDFVDWVIAGHNGRPMRSAKYRFGFSSWRRMARYWTN